MLCKMVEQPGGDAFSDNSVAVSPSEVRRRGLEPMGRSAGEEGIRVPILPHATEDVVPEYGSDEDDDEDVALQAALAMSMHQDEGEREEALKDNDSLEEDDEELWKSGEPFDASSFHAIMWDSHMTTDNDKSRWLSQGIDVRDKMQVDMSPMVQDSMLSIVGSNHGPWGLTQTHGGPCGVLAAVQAEMLRLILFGGRNPLEYPTEIMENQVIRDRAISEELVREAMAMSIAIIIARAALMPPAANETEITDKKSARIVLPSPPEGASYSGLTWEGLESTLKVYTVFSQPYIVGEVEPKRQKTPHVPREVGIIQLAHSISKLLLHLPPAGKEPPLEYFRQPGGVILLTLSVVSSRGDAITASDMDDPMGTKLTSQFGHCGQELMNLLLTGQAVSNVFDNTLTPSGALTCRGVQSRPSIGYLSQLEAMRYCEVGGYYKNPRFPIWVVGSTSHFTVLFGDPACLKESKSDALLEKCRRAFKAIEGGDENGYIATASLGKVFDLLELDVGGESAVQTLGAAIEVSGAGIILWDDFWKTASRLLTGASFVSVLQGTDDSSTSSDKIPPLLLTEFGETSKEADKKPAAKAPSALESDEEMAWRLAKEWGVGAENSPAVASAAAARPSSPMEMDPVLSDEELARRLQAEWDSEIMGISSVDGVSVSSVFAMDGSSTRSVAAESGTMPELSPQKNVVVIDGMDNAKPHWQHVSNEAGVDVTEVADGRQLQEDSKMAAKRKLDFETFGNSFRLYHYNGLRGGSLTPFRVTRLTPEEAVGASVALTNSIHPGGEKAGDLEDVIRTKWPSCIIDWLGKQPPYID